MQFQHAQVRTDVDKMEIRNVVRKQRIERREINLLNDEMLWNQLEEGVINLVDVGIPNLKNVPVYYHVNYCKAALALAHCHKYALRNMLNYYYFLKAVYKSYLEPSILHASEV